jgi:ABC-type lipoprotein export system ATPase subunit
MDLLRHLGRTQRAAVIVVTHDERMIEGFDRGYHIPIVESLVVDCGREEMKSMPD